MTAQLEALIEKAELPPALPATTVKLIQLLNDPRASVDQIIEAVQYDQTLTGQILRLCNSAYFGLSRRIGSLREAVAYLGTRQLMQLVVGAHFTVILNKAQPGYGLLAGMLWRHSSATAVTSDYLSRHFSVGQPSAMFTAGLLHDIGKVILGNLLADKYQDVMDLLESSTITFPEAERRILGFTHAEVGERLASHWRLPEYIVAATRYHHEPLNYHGPEPAARDAAEIVHVADSIALSMGMGLGCDGLRYNIQTRIMEKFQLRKDVLDRLSVEMFSDLQRLEKVYQQ